MLKYVRDSNKYKYFPNTFFGKKLMTYLDKFNNLCYNYLSYNDIKGTHH